MASWKEAMAPDASLEEPHAANVDDLENTASVFGQEGGPYILLHRGGHAADLTEEGVTAKLQELGIDPNSGWRL